MEVCTYHTAIKLWITYPSKLDNELNEFLNTMHKLLPTSPAVIILI